MRQGNSLSGAPNDTVRVELGEAFHWASQGNPGEAPQHSEVVSRSQSVEARLNILRNLSNDQLAQQVRALSTQKHVLDAELLLHLSEMDWRQSYREQACSSLFGFCVSRLGFSEDAAYKRVGVARMLREYPLVFELLSEGTIHLAALMLIKPHLTQENHREWLTATTGKSKREVEKLVATHCPKPDVATRVRRLPQADSGAPRLAAFDSGQSAPMAQEAAPPFGSVEPIADVPLSHARSAQILGSAAPMRDESSALASYSVPPVALLLSATETSSVSSSKSSVRARIEPLSCHSYRVVFTASERLKQKMDRARALVSHAVSPADLPALIERALDLLIERTERRRFGRKRVGDRAPEPVGTETSDGATASGLALDLVVSGTSDGATASGLAPKLIGSCPSDDAAFSEFALELIGGATVDVRTENSELAIGPVGNSGIDEMLGDLSLGQAVAGTVSYKRSRHVAVAVQRDVWERDQGRCTYVDRDGNRCEERHFLQMDHREAHGLGGPPTRENLRLRCPAHNALYAEQVYGSEQMAAVVVSVRARRKCRRCPS